MYIKYEDIKLVKDKTGLSHDESFKLLHSYDGNIDLILKTADSLSGSALAKDAISNNIKNAKEFQKLAESLSKYNTNRGGANFKGFVFEEMHATNATINGQVTEVIANNGPADFLITNSNGKVISGQAKVGYEKGTVDWSKYTDQTIVIDKGNTQLANKAKNAGCDVLESNISKKEAEQLANSMKLESKVTGNKNSTIVPKTYSTGQIAKQCHSSGINAAKSGAAFGAGLSIGSNIVELIDGEKEIGEVAVDVAKDTAIAAGTSYVVGAATTAIASTSVGAAAIGSATAAATAATTAVASTAVGGAAIGAATAATTAITGAATAATTAVASTAVGGAAIGAATAATTALASTAVGAAVVAAAPVVAAGAVLGGAFTLGKKIFRK